MIFVYQPAHSFVFAIYVQSSNLQLLTFVTFSCVFEKKRKKKKKIICHSFGNKTVYVNYKCH